MGSLEDFAGVGQWVSVIKDKAMAVGLQVVKAASLALKVQPPAFFAALLRRDERKAAVPREILLPSIAAREIQPIRNRGLDACM